MNVFAVSQVCMATLANTSLFVSVTLAVCVQSWEDPDRTAPTVVAQNMLAMIKLPEPVEDRVTVQVVRPPVQSAVAL